VNNYLAQTADYIVNKTRSSLDSHYIVHIMRSWLSVNV